MPDKKPILTLQFPESNIRKLAAEYEGNLSKKDWDLEKELIDLKPHVQKVGYLTKEHLKTVAKWKARRVAGHINKNGEGCVREITKFALSTSDQEAAIKSLTSLNGVGWPMASVVLHFFHRKQYPVLDRLALESIGVKPPPQSYTFSFWWEYVEFCRDLAKRNSVDMRILDKALWTYSPRKP